LQRAEEGQDNHWVVKLALGARSVDPCLTDSAALVVRYREAPGGDRIVQKYVSRPVLFKNRKVDLRVSFSECACLSWLLFGLIFITCEVCFV
jgi:hypothetical protein